MMINDQGGGGGGQKGLAKTYSCYSSEQIQGFTAYTTVFSKLISSMNILQVIISSAFK